MEVKAVKTVLLDVFEELALTAGGIVAFREVDDEVVWALAKGIDGIRRRALQRLEDMTIAEGRPQADVDASPHPAIEELLKQIGRSREREEAVV